MVAIIDYDAGNIKSVEKAIHFLGREAVITRDSDVILSADHVILPGVGAFGDAMAKIRQYNLETVINEACEKGIPFLGVCLGLQLMFDESEEAPGVRGLGLLKGKIKLIPDDEGKLKVPHMGWNSLAFPNKGRLYEGINEESFVYFVHSYYLEAEDRSIVKATTYYGTLIDASVEKDNIFACQFHPEKSSDVGMTILENFLNV